MDFDVLILAHSNWKRRFHEHLRGKQELDVETVRQVNLCNMGRWLCGEGLRHKDLPEYRDLDSTRWPRMFSNAPWGLPIAKPSN